MYIGTNSAEQPPTIEISKYDQDLHQGASVNITATIHSDPPIVFLNWGVVGGDLPPNTKNYTYSDNRFTILELRSLCYSDSGSYTITAANEYGPSVGYAPIQISKGMSQLCQMLIHFLHLHIEPPVDCMYPGMIIQSPPTTMTTVKGECLQLFCSVHGFVLCDHTFYSIRNISSPKFNGSINIHDNSTYPNYSLAVYQNEDYCIFINQLIIHNVSLDLNGAILTCIESIDEYGRQLLSARNVTMSE